MSDEIGDPSPPDEGAPSAGPSPLAMGVRIVLTFGGAGVIGDAVLQAHMELTQGMGVLFLDAVAGLAAVLCLVGAILVVVGIVGPRTRRALAGLALIAAAYVLGFVPGTRAFRIHLSRSAFFDGLDGETAAWLMGGRARLIDARWYDLAPVGTIVEEHNLYLLGDRGRSELLLRYDAHERVVWTRLQRKHEGVAPLAFDAAAFRCGDEASRYAMALDLEESEVLSGLDASAVEALLGPHDGRARLIDNWEDEGFPFGGLDPYRVPLDGDGRVRHE
ncbi:MAG: hypothetical protein H6825_06895 [Planctomycetes bacterium]|nr:hypothetical protein [Planctomycetota bacterium]